MLCDVASHQRSRNICILSLLTPPIDVIYMCFSPINPRTFLDMSDATVALATASSCGSRRIQSACGLRIFRRVIGTFREPL